jgi:hypothetical protein
MPSRWFSRPAFGQCGDFFSEPFGIDDVGIEVIRNRLGEFGMTFPLGVIRSFSTDVHRRRRSAPERAVTVAICAH